MKFKIIELKGVGPQAAKALGKAGYYYAEELLEIDPAVVAKKTGLDVKKVQAWKDYVHLMKIRTLGPAYANIMHRPDVGVLNIQMLAAAKAPELLEKMTKSNKARRYVLVSVTRRKCRIGHVIL